MIKGRRMKEKGGEGGGEGGGRRRNGEKLINTEDWNVRSNIQIIGIFKEGNQSKEIELILKLILQKNFQKRN